VKHARVKQARKQKAKNIIMPTVEIRAIDESMYADLKNGDAAAQQCFNANFLH